jgi:hypothetical protein
MTPPARGARIEESCRDMTVFGREDRFWGFFPKWLSCGRVGAVSR